jgi:hypothetical protein
MVDNMERVTVQTPLGTVTLEHSGTKAVAKGDDLALDWWQRRVDGILFGAQGHIFNTDDCDICDVLEAAASAVGRENITASKKAVADATQQVRSTPKGAIP